jgi:hypothetical protein
MTLTRLKEEKNVRMLSFVHDIERLRGNFRPYLNHEYEFMLKNADVFIVHNDIMADYLVGQGIERDRIVVLTIFDYLTANEIKERKFDKTVVIAGSLERKKSSYVERLEELYGVKVHLYGPQYEGRTDMGNVEYHGFFPADKIAGELTGGFGLIWDGDSLETCTEGHGGYLKYNCPHKLSLYLASGLPVIIWKEAAAAKFVEEHGVGFTVSSLYELQEALDRVTPELYGRYLESVGVVSQRIRSGFYTKKALANAEKVLKGDAKDGDGRLDT